MFLFPRGFFTSSGPCLLPHPLLHPSTESSILCSDVHPGSANTVFQEPCSSPNVCNYNSQLFDFAWISLAVYKRERQRAQNKWTKFYPKSLVLFWVPVCSCSVSSKSPAFLNSWQSATFARGMEEKGLVFPHFCFHSTVSFNSTAVVMCLSQLFLPHFSWVGFSTSFFSVISHSLKNWALSRLLDFPSLTTPAIIFQWLLGSLLSYSPEILSQSYLSWFLPRVYTFRVVIT